MKNLWCIFILLVACKTESQTEPQQIEGTAPLYETYDYKGFTKAEKQAYLKFLLEGGNLRQGGDRTRYYFLNFSEVEKHSRIARPATPLVLRENPRTDVKNFKTPAQFQGGGLPLKEYIQKTQVDGLIIIHKGNIVFEGYPRMFPNDFHVNYSVTKTYVSTAVAILEDRGLINTKQPIDTYLEDLKGSDWEGISIVDILAMSSGMESGESSSLLRSAYTTQEQINALRGAKSVKPSGTKYDYRGLNTTALTLLVEHISGLEFNDFLQREIWQKIGAAHDGLMGQYDNGLDATSGYGMSSTLRDMARFGLAFTPSGRKHAQIISDGHLARIRDVNPKLKAKSWYSTDLKTPSYQWDEVYEDGDFYKGGHGGQGLYISPAKDLVVAFYGTYDINRQEHRLPALSRILAKSGLFD